MSIMTAAWRDPDCISRAGIIIYLAHVAQPKILEIEQLHGRRFTTIETLEASVRRTAGMISATIQEGLNTPHVAAHVAAIAARHRTMGIRPWMMRYIAATVAVAPCWVLGSSYEHADPSYHTRMDAFASAMGATLPQQPMLEPWLRGTIQRRGEITAAGIAPAVLLARRYPEHLQAVAANGHVPALLRCLAEAGHNTAERPSAH